eukprot:187716-Prymnesium_polylepis.1
MITRLQLSSHLVGHGVGTTTKGLGGGTSVTSSLASPTEVTFSSFFCTSGLGASLAPNSTRDVLARVVREMMVVLASSASSSRKLLVDPEHRLTHGGTGSSPPSRIKTSGGRAGMAITAANIG